MSEVSWATGRETEHRKGVDRTRSTAEVKPSGLPGRAFAAQTTAHTAIQTSAIGPNASNSAICLAFHALMAVAISALSKMLLCSHVICCRAAAVP